MDDFSVFGANGFVGRNLVEHLRKEGASVRAITRSNWPAREETLGHVVYAIGMTSDFRSKPFETIDAHVSVLMDLLRAGKFKSFLYLSSTRIYRGAAGTAEDEPLCLTSVDPDRIYDLSKLCGEALCLSRQSPTVRVARLSNVFGPGDTSENFLNAVVCEATRDGRVVLHQSLNSEKDYVHVSEVCTAIEHIALNGRERVYNVAAGTNTSHGQIAAILSQATGAEVTVAPDAASVIHRRVDVSRLAAEMDWQPAPLVDYLCTELCSSGCNMPRGEIA